MRRLLSNAAMHRILLAALVVAASLVVACGEPNAPPPGALAKSKLARITAAAPAADVEATVAGNTAFALDVYRALAPQAGNLAFSPYSVTTALGMTYPGARGDTEKAFDTTLKVQLPQPQWHRAMNTIDRALSSRGAGASGKDGQPFRLRTNNQLFAQKGYTLLPGYLDVLATEYGAGVRLLDFAGAAEASRTQINAWVETNTEGLIKELLAPGLITADTRLALVNTLYFNAAWKKPFPHDKTSLRAFTLLDGSTKQVPMMAGEDLVGGHAVVDGVDVVELPYSGDEVSMVLLAPPAGKLADFEAGLSAAKLQALAVAPTQGSLALRLPRFEVRTQARLDEVLKALGLGVAFSAEADFSGMTGTRELAITAVVHEAVVKTDEDGTEAAAATAVVVGRVSIPEYVEVNRPFLYVIRDRGTGAVLFLGRVVEP